MNAASATHGGASEFELRHRNPVAMDYVIVSRVILVGYPGLSDGAKLTYWVIYSHDWFEPSRGGRKGFAFPTIGRLARLRHTSERTIQRHLGELIAAHLITREERPGRPSLLYIEEPGSEEVARYLAEQGGDTNVTPTPDRNVAPMLKQEKSKQDQSVNGDQEKHMEVDADSQPRPLASIGSLLQQRPQPAPTGKHRVVWLAEQMADATGDRQDLGCYIAIAKRCPEPLVFQALSLLKEALRDGPVLRSKGGVFISTVRRLCQEVGLPNPLPRTVGSASRSASVFPLQSDRSHYTSGTPVGLPSSSAPPASSRPGVRTPKWLSPPEKRRS
jgi:hypothetical protein